MASIRSTVYYCCVWNGARVLYAYNDGGDREIEKLAVSCLEKAPSHHKWYFQSMFNKTFGFLMEDGFVYFAIIDENLGNPATLDFLEHVRDEFKKAAKIGSNRSISNLNPVVLQEQLMPVIQRLIVSLGNVIETKSKSSLLGKSSKKDKRKTRDHVISVRENGVVDSSSLDPNNQGGSGAGIQITKEASSISRPSTETVGNKWCRKVRIVLAIDVAVCLILFIVWIAVCRGIKCIR